MFGSLLKGVARNALLSTFRSELEYAQKMPVPIQQQMARFLLLHLQQLLEISALPSPDALLALQIHESSLKTQLSLAGPANPRDPQHLQIAIAQSLVYLTRDGNTFREGLGDFAKWLAWLGGDLGTELTNMIPQAMPNHTLPTQPSAGTQPPKSSTNFAWLDNLATLKNPSRAARKELKAGGYVYDPALGKWTGPTRSG
jgi:hypothetical protein